MKYNTCILMKRLLLVWIVWSTGTILWANNELKTLTDSLYVTIKQKDFFVQQKEQRIIHIKNMLKEEGMTPDKRYEINFQLCEEYRKFNVDSAIHYANRNIEIARQEGNLIWKYRSALRISLLYSMCGSFREAEGILTGMDKSRLNSELLALYYEAYACFWDYYSISAKYSEKSRRTYLDSMLLFIAPDSYSYKIAKAASYVEYDSLKAENAFQKLLESEKVGTPQYAMLTNHYASVNLGWGNREKAKKYFILSAITDIRNATRETLSLQALALLFYEENRLSDAFYYTQSTIDDIISSGITFRATEIYNFYSIITMAFQAEESRAKSNLVFFLVSMGVGVLVLFALVVYIYRQMKGILRIKQALARSNDELLSLNEKLNNINGQLNEKNSLLHENNNIKEHYIAQFFDVCFSYIHKMEQNQNKLYKLAVNKSYTELIGKLRTVAFIEEELNALYTRFDTVFLSLYPTFVKDFNALLRDGEKVVLKPGSLLNKELRIYALLRLGISDSGKIAEFLRCSVSTVYNYRTKMRNRALINRDEFENQIMKIGSEHYL